MDEDRMVAVLREEGTERMVINSAVDWGRSDPLKVAKTANAMRQAGFSEDEIDKVVWRNPLAFYGQSGRLQLEQEEETTETFAGNSILRGEKAG
jgi:predicted metal-dependent TIM-barrel fold hydrolase